MSNASHTVRNAPIAHEPAHIDVKARPQNDPARATASDPARIRADVVALQHKVARIALPAGVRARFDAQVADKAATRTGRHCTTQNIVDDCTDDLPGVIDAVLAGEVPRFGPLAMRYTVDICAELVDRWRARSAHEAKRAGASVDKTITCAQVLACRTELASRIDAVLTADSPQKAALARASRMSKRTLGNALTAIETTLMIASEVLDLGKDDADLKVYLDDASFTAAAIAEITAPVEPALTARAGHTKARKDSQIEQARIDALEGHLRDQLMRLSACIDAARAQGAAIPSMPLARIRGGTSANAANTLAQTPVAPPIAAPAAPPAHTNG